MIFRSHQRPGPFRILAVTFTLLGLLFAGTVVLWAVDVGAYQAYADSPFGVVLFLLALAVGYPVDRWRARRRIRRGVGS
ncbi:hypothetical protein [Sphaerisporangium aureirubrum]|uniref:Uncharacterized protein n=1 Tax=Sphaerisporangium aureirubrum TaxID=1544736 RepID=A0ABW1NDF0_9ACTN